MAAPAPGSLEGFPEPFAVIGSQYCFDYEVALVIKERIFSLHERADINDIQGNRQFGVSESFFSIRDKKTIVNTQNEPVCTILEKIFSLHDTTYICGGSSNDIGDAIVTAKKAIFSFKTSIDIYLKDSNDSDFKITGDFKDHNFTVTDKNDKVVASIGRRFDDLGSVITDSDAYIIRIARNFDIALATALAVLVDEMLEEDKD
eukprot:TRINITY_DN7068_c0_g1_i1.p1 TRINITY_DN7068_c0_g1~~TRINITY_DN7068_c0_g1_i1.p1  ORF type:complete len:203 (+),score=32.32 TRINITY_DN7068_c0_g1_i1:149-757(+)